MNDDLDLELERYELFAGPTYNFNFNRRQFLKAFSGGIALIVPVSNLLAQDQGESGRRGNERVPNDIGAWIHIDEKGTVSVFTGKVEIGQNIRTSLTQAVAEELHVPLDTVRVVMADTATAIGYRNSRVAPDDSPTAAMMNENSPIWARLIPACTDVRGL